MVIDIKWLGGSVSGLVVIAGIICFILYSMIREGIFLFLGTLFVILGLIGALVMTWFINR